MLYPVEHMCFTVSSLQSALAENSGTWKLRQVSPFLSPLSLFPLPYHVSKTNIFKAVEGEEGVRTTSV